MLLLLAARLFETLAADVAVVVAAGAAAAAGLAAAVAAAITITAEPYQTMKINKRQNSLIK